MVTRTATRSAALALVALAGLATLPALAGEEEAEACLRERVWDGYSDGWGIRTMTATTLETGKTRNYLVTLYKGNSYRIEACGDESVVNVDVLLYDANGAVLTRDNTVDRSPRLEFQPEKTGSYYVVVYQRELTSAKKAGVAMAVVYR